MKLQQLMIIALSWVLGVTVSAYLAALAKSSSLVNLVRFSESVKRILDPFVVIIDPMRNPDGRDRMISYFNQYRGPRPNADLQAAEHLELWPNGRTNHYLFDLNGALFGPSY